MKLPYFFIGVVFFFVSACRSTADGVEQLPLAEKPTPYKLEIPGGLPPMPIPPENPLTVEGIALGKKLFFDPILSGNNQQACGDCHRQSFSFTDSETQFSVGIDQIAGNRNAMPLVNLGWQKKFFWDGGAANLESQVIAPIMNPIEMHEDLNRALAELRSNNAYRVAFKKAFGTDSITTQRLMFAIAQFERTLVSGNAKFDKVRRGDATFSPQELRGQQLFVDMDKGDCSHCHVLGSTFSDFEFRNTGLDATPIDEGRFLITLLESDKGKFKTPSLRNIELTKPYMHDGRFATLEQVLEFYNSGFSNTPNLDPALAHATKGRLTPQDKADIVVFLKTLTDFEFLNNPEFKQ